MVRTMNDDRTTSLIARLLTEQNTERYGAA
jgi:hypothetical protein